jgi:hypothetical protein
MATLREDGSWSDVDYSNTSTGSWITVHHLARLQKLTRCVVVPGSDRYGDAAVQDAVTRALDYWLREDFVNANWWWNRIGVPRSLVQTLLLLEDRLSEWELAEGTRIVSRARIGGTGANLADLAGIEPLENEHVLKLPANSERQRICFPLAKPIDGPRGPPMQPRHDALVQHAPEHAQHGLLIRAVT